MKILLTIIILSLQVGLIHAQNNNKKLFQEKVFSASYFLQAKKDTAEYYKRINSARKLIDKQFFANTGVWASYIEVLCKQGRIKEAEKELKNYLQYAHIRLDYYDHIFSMHFDSVMRNKVVNSVQRDRDKAIQKHGAALISIIDSMPKTDQKYTGLNRELSETERLAQKEIDILNLRLVTNIINQYGINEIVNLDILLYIYLIHGGCEDEMLFNDFMMSIKNECNNGNFPNETYAFFYDMKMSKTKGKMIYGSASYLFLSGKNQVADLANVDKIRNEAGLAPLWVKCEMDGIPSPKGYIKGEYSGWKPAER